MWLDYSPDALWPVTAHARCDPASPRFELLECALVSVDGRRAAATREGGAVPVTVCSARRQHCAGSRRSAACRRTLRPALRRVFSHLADKPFYKPFSNFIPACGNWRRRSPVWSDVAGCRYLTHLGEFLRLFLLCGQTFLCFIYNCTKTHK